MVFGAGGQVGRHLIEAGSAGRGKGFKLGLQAMILPGAQDAPRSREASRNVGQSPDQVPMPLVRNQVSNHDPNKRTDIEPQRATRVGPIRKIPRHVNAIINQPDSLIQERLP